MSQNSEILTHLQSGRTVTALTALNLFGCLRLASRISELRSQGADIVSTLIKTDTGKTVAEYSIEVSE